MTVTIDIDQIAKAIGIIIGSAFSTFIFFQGIKRAFFKSAYNHDARKQLDKQDGICNRMEDILFEMNRIIGKKGGRKGE